MTLHTSRAAKCHNSHNSNNTNDGKTIAPVVQVVRVVRNLSKRSNSPQDDVVLLGEVSSLAAGLMEVCL